MGKKNKRSQDEPELELEPELTKIIDGDSKKKKNKKKRSREDTKIEPEQKMSLDGDTKKKKKKKKKKKQEEEEKRNVEDGRATVSIAIAGSIIHNTQSLELATRLAGQIARAATIFRIDEIVVFDNKSSSEIESAAMNPSDSNESGASFLVRILKYLETPQYLRKSLFPKQNDLRYVGMLPPLDAPHHLRKHEWEQYREGVTLNEKAPNSEGTMVDVGLSKSVVVDQVLSPGVRVTVAMGTDHDLDLVRQIVPPSKPREEAGMYWGYKVRYASQLSSVFKECPFQQGGYDYLIGTSEHGVVISSSELKIPTFRHLLIAFGGLAGLEESIEDDNQYKGKNVRDVFNIYLNTCPHQGSRTIRAEEAMFISLQYFQEPISRAVRRL
ncbi:putative methyltransferase C9orf114 homolog isoform X1 [Arabidopsis lyrata subsp. lyrata]|uniref:putative methyltransferase C9orf114 homolog isoform X1 n=1 Tax=Arabidopsis lyrata subsp. lyrata TaxID=81972 RepID=UPI000A29DAC0|nr:putative methyltransferase C9orf114 homolog isoform X1 [Arabidopsis lyrata subsp. lyrata]|eukprot:XP_020878276.1 putative methyltransferase C9orf114 homolog isoform X1 [Arabidopsis lyrata subsp. lyrata]